MTSVTISGTELVIAPRGLDKIWGFRRELRIPIAHIRSATVESSPGVARPGLRLLGLSLPGKDVGTFFQDGQHSYWNVSHGKHNIVVEFSNEGFARAVLTVKDPAATVRDINRAISTHKRQ